MKYRKGDEFICVSQGEENYTIGNLYTIDHIDNNEYISFPYLIMDDSGMPKKYHTAELENNSPFKQYATFAPIRSFTEKERMIIKLKGRLPL